MHILSLGWQTNHTIGIFVLNWEANSKLLHSNAAMLLLKMYFGWHNCPHKYTFGIHTCQDDLHAFHPTRVQKLKCYKSTYCWTVWNTENMIRYFTNWIFGLWNLKYHERYSDFCTLSSSGLHNYGYSNSTWNRINIFNMFVTSNPRISPLSQLIIKWVSYAFFIRFSCIFLGSNWRFKKPKWTSTKLSIYV
jgi:hypothetical protein